MVIGQLMVKMELYIGVTAKHQGNNRNNTCNGALKGSLNVGAATRGDEDIEKNLQKMIPDGWIGRFLLDAPP